MDRLARTNPSAATIDDNHKITDVFSKLPLVLRSSNMFSVAKQYC